MSDRVVIVKGIAGLGNRLRVVAASIEYAKKTNRKVYIDWKDGMFSKEGTNAFNRFFRIVDYPHLDDSTELDVETYYPAIYKKLNMDTSIYYYFEKKQMKNRFVRKGYHYLFKGFHKIGNLSSKIDGAVCRWSQSYQAFVLKKEYREKYKINGKFAFGAHLSKTIDADAVIYCDNIPFYSAETMRKHIVLQPDIQQKVDRFVAENQLNKDTVGIHIRASGKKCYGDVQKLIIKLKKYIADHHIERVFICTDNGPIEELFRQEFTDRLVVQKKYIPEIREGETGIHDFAQNSNDEELKLRLTEEAIIDMFALAQTPYLFYQFGSTFSEISRVYHPESEKCRSWMNL